MLQAILSWSHVETPMESIVKGLSRGKPTVESNFFDSVIGEFGIHQSLSYFVAANLSNELVAMAALMARWSQPISWAMSRAETFGLRDMRLSWSNRKTSM